MTALRYIVDNGPGTEWETLPVRPPLPERVIGIQIDRGESPIILRSVRGRGVTRITKCGHPSKLDGQCILPPGHNPGAHVYDAQKPNDHSTP